MLKVGLDTFSFTPSPKAMPPVKAVLPAPKSPDKVITAPGKR